MGDVLTFTPRPRPVAPSALEPASDLPLRAQLEEAAEFAVDTAQRLIAILDGMDGDADLRDGGEAEPSLAAPETQGSQATWTRGTDRDHETEAPEIALPEVALQPWPLPWSGRANVIAVAGVALIDLIERVV